MPSTLVSRAVSLALLGLGLACASAKQSESHPRGSRCTVEAAADGGVHVANEGLGYALELPQGARVDCEGDGAFAELGMLSADYEQPSVGLVNVLLMAVPSAKGGDAHDAHGRLLEQFHSLDVDSLGIPADTVQTVAAGPRGRELRCYGGPTGGELERNHYYACTGVEQRGDGAVLGSVIRVLASSEEWRVNGDASVHMIQALSRAWTLTPAAGSEAAPPAGPDQALGCAEHLGVEPQALAAACGFGPLIAQTEQQTFCELQYATSTGQPGAVVSLREFRNRDADAAWSLHRAAFGETRELPFVAKKIIIALLGAVARNDRSLARSLLSPGAGFGAPDRREFDAWSIAEGDNFSTFMAALRGVASRFPSDTRFSCPPLKPEEEDGVARGEHPMWCSYVSADSFDLLVFRLLAIDGVAHVDYVGMFETRPTGTLSPPVPELSMSAEPLPPLTPDALSELPAPTR